MKPNKPPKPQSGQPPTGLPKFDQGKEVRAIARERVGIVKPAQVIEEKKQRRKPKHKLPAGTIPES